MDNFVHCQHKCVILISKIVNIITFDNQIPGTLKSSIFNFANH